MIQFKQVSMQYKPHRMALSNIQLTIQEGMFGLLGPNGAGKSTFMRMLASLIRPTSGHVLIDGIDLEQRARDIRKLIGYLPQSFMAHPSMTGREFMDYIGIMKGMHQSSARSSHITATMEEVGLASKLDDRISTYSGGMIQRLGIAQAMLGNPPFLIVDEPTASLDPEERVRFRLLMNRYAAQHTVVLSTHIVADIEASCSKVAVLNRGAMVYMGTTQELSSLAEGKVWSAVLTDEEFMGLKKARLVSAKRLDSGVECRMISTEKPVSGATPVSGMMEDGYLALLEGDHHL